jgi:glucosamine-6-phosphate deaminase
MEVIIQSDSQKASQLAAKIVADLIRKNNNSILGLATGSTPLLLYRELIKMHREEGLDFSKITTFNLDEYVGLSPSHPASYRNYMWDNFFKHINIPEHKIHIPDGTAPDIPAFCREYEGAIMASGGIDLQILGIGTDAHIGFNEPSSSLASRTRIKTLTEQTIQDNVPFFKNEEIPRHVITMGIGTIMECRKCMLLAFGEKKADAIARSIEGPITSTSPASILQMHPEAIFILDEAAAGNLKRKDYYKWVYENKPDWQKI